MMRLPPILMLLFAAACPAFLVAASFDCADANLLQEKMICADSVLSGYDDELAQIYTSAVSGSSEANAIRKQQKAWLRDIRNKCLSKTCLVDAYQKRINELNSSRPDADKAGSGCPVSEEMLIGAWKNVSGGLFEEMAFEYSGSKREFNSWLHQRPEISGGAWEIENCTINIRHPTEADLSFVLTVLRAHGDRLYLRDKSENKDIAVYKRINQ